eukprot:1181563-Prorocentrum_minimum.AAC.1
MPTWGSAAASDGARREMLSTGKHALSRALIPCIVCPLPTPTRTRHRESNCFTALRSSANCLLGGVPGMSHLRY